MKRRLLNCFLFAAALLQSSIACGQNVSAKLDSLFAAPEKPLNGNVLVAESGNVIYQKSVGFADFRTKAPNSESSRFNIASVSKTFTAVAILQLMEKGKLQLDDPVKKHLADFPYDAITIRNLLSHTSGLPDVDLFDDITDPVVSNRHVVPALIRWKTQLSFKAGEKWEYSNVNFNLLALIVEHVSGQTFSKYLEANIFSKAGMSQTYILEDYLHARPDKMRVKNHQLPQLYSAEPIDVQSPIFPFVKGLRRLSGLKGDGDIIASSNDLLRFDQSLYNGILLKPATLDQAFTPTRLNNGEPAYTFMNFGKNAYGLGWFIFEDESHGKIVWHTGGIPGSVSIFLRNVTKHQTVVLLDNASSVGIYRLGVNAMKVLNDATPLLVVKRSLVREYAKALVAKGVDAAFCRWKELNADAAQYRLDENEMNNMGLALLEEKSIIGHKAKALEALKFNTLLFPESSNAYDSYGEALAKTGKRDEAVFMYRKSLELNPSSESGKAALARLMGK